MTIADLSRCLALSLAVAAGGDDGATAGDSGVALDMARQALKPFMPQGPQTRRSDHFTLLTDADQGSAEEVLATLEASRAAVHRSLRSIGIEPPDGSGRLVAVLFRSAADFEAFNRRTNPGTPAWGVGYYDPITDRLVMFDLVSQPDIQGALAKVRSAGQRFEREVAASGMTPMQASAPGSRVNEVRAQIDHDRQRIKADARNGLMSTIAHEAAHGILFGAGVQRRGAGYPFWLSEGLATSFEPTHAQDRAFGFESDNPTRRKVFQDALRDGRCLPLAEFVMLDRAPPEDEQGAVGRLYAEACMFTKWLARERPTELRLYLDALRQGGWSDVDSRQRRFEEIFGPVDALERSWMRAEARDWAGLMATPMGERLRAFDRVRPSLPAPDAAATPAPASAPGR